mmetsp:Transcript_9491/g.9026  ORF Transcript_9491/g.9026 Transcript_9491/m.9026 type:complete len:149 (+) Transcript_9491:6686-7132(+)
MFKYLGHLLGMAIRSEQYLPLDLAPIFWKQILDEHIIESDQEKEMDLRSIDLYSYQALVYLKNKAESMNDADFEKDTNMKFVTQLSDGSEVELCSGGKHLNLTRSNVEEYCKKVVEVRLNESKVQIQAIVEGINFVIPKSIYAFFNWR